MQPQPCHAVRLARHGGDDRNANRIGPLPHHIPRRGWLVQRADCDGSDRASPQHPGQPADVVDVQVSDHEQGYADNLEPAQAAVDRAWLGAGIDHDRRV